MRRPIGREERKFVTRNGMNGKVKKVQSMNGKRERTDGRME